MKLSDQPWLKDSKTQKLLAAFGSTPIRFVGGCVRDAVMQRTVGDIDCATPATPDQTTALLESAGLKAIPTGIEHGTITAIVDSKPFEITTLRKDIACDGRHAEVSFTDDWQQDAARRDFTFNALYCDASGQIYDYTSGVSAAVAGRIEFIGNADDRITEDALRILRFFRFLASHGQGGTNAAAIAACAKYKAMLAGLSGERIQREMLKLLSAPKPEVALAAMQDIGVLEELLANASLKNISPHPQPILRLALMLPNATAAKEVSERWKLSNNDRKLLLLLLEHSYCDWPQSDLEIIHAARHLSPEHYQLLIWRNGARLAKSESDIQQILAQFEAIEIPVFPVGGDDLIARGISSGPELGATLKKLEVKWEESDYQMSKQALLSLI